MMAADALWTISSAVPKSKIGGWQLTLLKVLLDRAYKVESKAATDIKISFFFKIF